MGLGSRGGALNAYYRSQAAERCLKWLGLTVVVYEVDNLDIVSLKDVAACLFVRTPLTSEVGLLIDRLKSANVMVLVDFDDLLFRPDLLHLIDGIHYLTDVECQEFIERITLEIIKIADCVVVTTLPLAEEAARYDKNVRVIRNYPLEISKRLSM